jgi:hypothetical protein
MWQKFNLMRQIQSSILRGNQKSNHMWQSKVQFYVAIQSPIIRGNQKSDLMRQFVHLVLSWFLHIRQFINQVLSMFLHLLSIFVWFLYLRQFVRLLRLRHLSFQFCSVLTPEAAMFPLFGSYASGNVSFVWPPSKQQSIPGLAPEPAAISQSPSKQRHMSLLISPI